MLKSWIINLLTLFFFKFNFQNGAKFFDLEKKLPIPFGFTLDYEA